MKHVIHSLLHTGLALLLALSSIIAPLTMSSAEANSCYDIFAGAASAKMGYREVRLEPGDQVWGYYSCKSCAAQVSAKPNKYKRQECPNCGTAHSNENYARPETIERNGKLYLLEPSDLIKEGDPTGALARSGVGWTCSFCSSSNFQIQPTCTGCGAPKLETSTASSTRDALIPDASSLSNERIQPIATKSSSIRVSNNAVSSETAINLQRPASTSSFIRTKLGMALLSGGVAGLTGFVWWGSQAYSIQGQVTSIQGNTAFVTYEDRNGESKTIDITPPNASVSIRDWRIGDPVKVYFRNLTGAKGAEGVDGKVFAPKAMAKP